MRKVESMAEDFQLLLIILLAAMLFLLELQLDWQPKAPNLTIQDFREMLEVIYGRGDDQNTEGEIGPMIHERIALGMPSLAGYEIFSALEKAKELGFQSIMSLPGGPNTRHSLGEFPTLNFYEGSTQSVLVMYHL